MKKFWAIFRIYLIDTLSYRGDLFLYTLSSVIFPLLVLLIWLVVDSSGQITFFSRNDFIIYYLLVLILKVWTSAWASVFISRDIRYGKLSPFLVRPIPYLTFQLGNNLAEKVFKSAFLIPIIVILFLTFSTRLPSLSPPSLIFVVASSLMSVMIYFLSDICIGFSAFWLDDSSSLGESWSIFTFLFSGGVIPLAAMPLIWQNIGMFLPFRYTLSFPIEIAMNKLSPYQLSLGFGFQISWLILALTAYYFIWKRGRRKYSAVGA